MLIRPTQIQNPADATKVLLGDGTFGAVPGGGGTLTVQDENSNVATGVTQIDFQGAGVTAAAGTGEVVVTIPGGGSSTATAKVVKQSGTQSIPNSTWTTVIWDTEVWDTDTMADLATNNDRITCVTAGKYRVIAGIVFAVNSTGTRGVAIDVTRSGVTTTYSSHMQTGVTSLVTGIDSSVEIDLAVGDFVIVQVNQTSGAALNIGNTVTDPRTFLSVSQFA